MIIDRGETREVTEVEVREIRKEISHWARSPRNTIFHIPGEDGHSALCTGSATKRWQVDPIEAWLIWYRRVCSDCADEFLNQ